MPPRAALAHQRLPSAKAPCMAVDAKPMEVVELLPLIWATLARSQNVCPWQPYGRGSSGHIRGGMASNPHTMNTREHHGRRLSAKNSGRRWTLPAVPMGAGGRPPSVGKLVTSSFPWAVSGVLDGCEVGADRPKHRSAWNNPSALKSPPTDIVLLLGFAFWHVRRSATRIKKKKNQARNNFTGITFNTRTADPRTTHTLSQQPVAPWAYPEPYAAAAPLGPAARSRVRGADSLAQALDLLANPHRIVDDRRLGDQTRVV